MIFAASYQTLCATRLFISKLSQIMRLTIALMLVFVIKANATGYAQKVNIVKKHASLTEIFAAITQQTGFLFFYDKALIDKIEPIDVKITDATVQEALSECLKDHNLTYTIVQNTIVIQSKIVNKNAIYQTLNSDYIPPPAKIRGRVINQKGEPLQNASVLIANTKIGTTTDNEGNFILTIPEDQNAVLEISSVGFQKKMIKVGNQTEFNIVLELVTSGLNEVVVVGYGTQKKADLTGAVSTVDVGKMVSSRPATNVGSLLEGEVAGTFIHSNSGQPGAEGINILIRGTGSMGNSQPLVIIDGLESSMDNINPYDVATISVLKDAASASIYGTRAANGVILITTKRGKVGPVQIKYDVSFASQKPTAVPDFLGSADYAMLRNEALKNAGLPPSFTDEDIAKYAAGNDPDYPNTDWMDVLYSGSGNSQYHNLNFSGGNEKTRYSISMAYKQQKGVIKKVDADRANLRINLDNKITDWLSLGSNTALSYAVNTIPLTGPELTRGGDLQQFYNSVTHIPPTQKLKLSDGSWSGEYPLGNLAAWIDNGNLRRTTENKLVQSVFLEAKVLKGLSWRNRASVDYAFTPITNHISQFTYGGGQISGPSSNQENLDRYWVIDLESLLTYNKSFGKHGIKGLLGTSSRTENFKTTMAYRLGFPSNELTDLSAGSTSGLSNSGTSSKATLNSYFARLNYDYDGKYLFETNLRRDGSSKFASGKRWGWFPSVSAGWVLTQEKFLQDNKFVNFLKIRASWGQLGNDRIADYQYEPLISLGQNYAFGGVASPGASQTVANNPDVTWETTTEKNLGLDLKLFNNSFSLSVDAYDRYTDNILTTVPVSATFGLPPAIVNAGAMSNKGIESEFGYSRKKGPLLFDISVNASYNKNNVEKYAGKDVYEVASEGDAVVRQKGIPWNSYYGYEWVGYFQSEAEAKSSPVHSPLVGAGDLKFKDQNGDGVIDGNDRIILGNPIPSFTYGLNLSIRYKGFDFATFFHGTGDVSRYLRVRGYMPFMRNGKALSMHLDRMIVENGKVVKQGYFPETRLEGGPGGINVVSSGFTIHDASYLRMKNIQLGYTFPTAWTRSLSISNARIYISGQNLLTFTKFPDGYDPEVNDTPFHGHLIGGAAGWSYPQVKSYTIGLDISLN